MLIDYETLKKWIKAHGGKSGGTKTVAAWCARNRIQTFRDVKGFPITTTEAIDRALQRGTERESLVNFDPLPWEKPLALRT